MSVCLSVCLAGDRRRRRRRAITAAVFSVFSVSSVFLDNNNNRSANRSKLPVCDCADVARVVVGFVVFFFFFITVITGVIVMPERTCSGCRILLMTLGIFRTEGC